MGEPGVGVSRQLFRNRGSRTGEPRLAPLHHLAAAGIIGLQELADARFGPYGVVVDADGQIHRAVEGVRVAARLAPHRESLSPLPAEELRRRPYWEPAIEVA